MIKKFIKALKVELLEFVGFEDDPTEIFDEAVRALHALNIVKMKFEGNNPIKISLVLTLLSEWIAVSKQSYLKFFVFLPVPR